MSEFDDIIKQKADSHEAPVPPGAWENISKKKRKRRFIFWLLAVLIIAGVGTPAYLHFKNNDKQKQTVVVEPSAQNNAALNKKENSKEKEIAGTGENITTAATESIPSVVKEDNKASVVASGASNLHDEKKQVLFTVNKIKVSKKPVTKANSQPAEIAEDDLAANKNNSKRTPGKIKTEIINAAPEEINQDNDVKEKETGLKKSDLTVANTEKPAVDKTNVSSQKENKKQQTDSANKQTATVPKKTTPSKIKGLFADISFMPFMPFQQNTDATALSRTTSGNNALSEFKATMADITFDPSVAFQFALRKSISSKWFAGTGIQYMQLKETIELAGEETTTTSSVVQRLVIVNGQSVLIDDTVQTVIKGTRKINAVNSYRFISIPIFMQYNAGKLAGFDFSINGGLFFNIHSRYSNSINPLISSQANDAKNKTGIDVFAGLRLSKMYGRKVGLFAEPSFRFAIKQANIKDALVNKKIQQAGVSVGISILIK